MAYRSATLFPFTEAGESANNRKIRDTSGAANSATTTCVFGTNTTVRFIHAQPATANSTSATPAAAQDRGWHVLKVDMNETANTPNRRHIAAGTWTFQGCLTGSTADALSASYKVRVFMHKRSASGTLTQVGASTDSTAAAIAVANLDWTASVSLPEILLDTDETIHVEYWVQGRGGGATGLLAQTITFNVGTTTLQNELTIALPSTGITVRYLRSLSAIMVGIATKQPLRIFLRRSVVMVGLATLARKLTLFRSLPVTMVGVATLARKLTLRRALPVVMVGLVSLRRKVGIRRAVTMIGLATLIRKVGIKRLVTMVGVVSIRRKVGIKRLVTMVGVATLTRKLTLRRVLAVTMLGVVRGFARLRFDKIPGDGAAPQTSYPRSRVVNET